MKMICQTDMLVEHRIAKAFISGGLFVGLLILFLVPPANLPLPACVFHSITGHSCLTCGMTRSLHAIMRGDFAASIRYHLFGPVVFLGMLLCLMHFAAETIRGRRHALWDGGKIWSRVAGMVAILWFVYWGARLAAEFAAR
jgi:hypothetical protein